MLFNKWKEGTKKKKKQQTSEVPKRDWGDKPAVIGPGGSSKAHPKLISLSLLWSAGRWGNGEGGAGWAPQWQGAEWKMEFVRKLASAPLAAHK